LEEQQQIMGRLAATLEAYVVARPERQDRRSAAFVAASAHQVRFHIDRILRRRRPPSFLEADRISANIAATLLFLIAESPADAMEAAALLDEAGEDGLVAALISGVRELAFGDLNVRANCAIPEVVQDGEDPVPWATRQLWAHLLAGLRGLARELLGNRPGLTSIRHGQEQSALGRFQEVQEIAAATWESQWHGQVVSFPVYLIGPHHLASLLVLAAKDLAYMAVVNVPTPPAIEAGAWQNLLKQFAKWRPYLWQNHREVLEGGF
jgi:hypothetical protein